MGLFNRKREQAANLFATGAKAVGTVLEVRDTGMTINDNPRVRMTFRLEPLDGGTAFEAEKTTTVSRVDIPRAGDRYPAWYDLEDPTKWAYATIADDNGRATMKQLFGAHADTFTGMGGPTVTQAAPVTVDPTDQLAKLADLHRQGVLTDEEFAAQKAKLLA